MNKLERVEIAGLWGRKNVSLPLYEDLNFLIGPNSSGKTTIINLIAAVLQRDYSALLAADFRKITIQLTGRALRQHPVVEVHRNEADGSGAPRMRLRVRQSVGGKALAYDLGPDKVHTDDGADQVLAGLVQLPLLFTPGRATAIDPQSALVDQDVFNTFRGISELCGQLAMQCETTRRNHQKEAMLAYLAGESTVRGTLGAGKAGPERRESMLEMLCEFGAGRAAAETAVASYYKRISEVGKRVSKGQDVQASDLLEFFNDLLVDRMVGEWRELQQKDAEVLAPKKKFQEIVNGLLVGKSIEFSDAYFQPRVVDEAGREIMVPHLSSGEKHLLVMLGTVLLQENRPVVILVDEPESSLSPSWQSALFRRMRELNSACQIIAATHSPDIVGAHQDRVIQIAESVSDA